MSHFTVLVVGNDIEKILAPYQENCGDTKLPFDKFIDIEDADRKEYETDFDSEGVAHIKRYSSFEKFESDWNGHERDSETGRYGYWQNPNAKWDWFSVGGRWEGVLLLKNGEIADQANFDDIDWDGMRQKNKNAAQIRYDLVHRHCPINDTTDFISWEKAKSENKNIDDARKIYNGQKIISCFDNLKNKIAPDIFEWDDSVENYFISKEEYLQNAYNEPLTFAFADENGWQERGEMGWWACISNEKDLETASKNFYNFLDSVKGNPLVSVVDCHI